MLDPESVEGDDGAVFLWNSGEFSQNSLELITIHGFLFDQQFHEAAILTARRRKEAIGLSEIDDAVDRIIAGMEGRPLTDGRSKRLIAYHEVGHALIGTMVKDHDPVQKVTLIPRGQAQGLTWFSPDEEQTLVTRAQLKARIMGALGGRAAEDVVFGHQEVTTGAGGDIQQVASMARNMVCLLYTSPSPRD